MATSTSEVTKKLEETEKKTCESDTSSPVYSTSSRLNAILEAAFSSTHPLVKKALAQETLWRQRTGEELQALFEMLQKILEGSEEDPERIQEKTLGRLTTDLELVGKLNTALRDYSVGFERSDQVRYPLKFNKMDLAIQGALDFFQ